MFLVRPGVLGRIAPGRISNVRQTNPPPSKRSLAHKNSRWGIVSGVNSKSWWGIVFGVIATTLRNQLRKRILWQLFSRELRKFRVTERRRVWGLWITQNNSWGMNFLVITEFWRNAPPKLHYVWGVTYFRNIIAREGHCPASAAEQHRPT